MMNRSEFMFRLAQLLADLSQAERSEALQYYQDYFDDAGPENEQQIIAELGSPERVAASIKSGLSAEDTDQGEFSERGFTGYGEPGFDVPGRYRSKRAKFEQMKGQAEKKFNEFSGKFGEFSDKYAGQFKYRKKEGRGRNYGGSSDYSGSSDYGSDQDYSDSGYGGYNYDSRPTGGYRRRRRFSGGQIALIVILIIFASPILLGFAGAAVGLIFGALGVIAGVIAAVFGTTFAFVLGGLAQFIYGAARCFSSPVEGVMTCGISLLTMAAGALLVIVDAWLVTKVCPAIWRLIVKIWHRIFHKREESV